MYRSKLNEKLQESLAAVLPILAIVLILSFTIAPLPTSVLMAFLFGAVLLVVGMMFFSLGAELAMSPMGERVGACITKTRRGGIMLTLGFLLGFLITISEPDLQVLANQVQAVPNMVLIVTVAVGVGLFLCFAMLRMLLSVPLNTMLVGFYIVVFVLPNNKNIVMAAQQCAGLSEKKVIVIPTATVPQGISAMMAVDPDETDAAAIEQAMNAAASAVTTAQITYAARNSEFDGFAIREGDYLALLEGKLFDTDTSIGAVLEKLAAEADSRGAEFVNLFYGSDVSEEDAQKAGEQFGRLCPGAEINVVSGGQPVYYYIISME